MPVDRECIIYAGECLRLARMAEDPVIQARLTEMAHHWMAAARQETLDAAPPQAIEKRAGRSTFVRRVVRAGRRQIHAARSQSRQRAS
jgi:hypothetical protein